MKPRLSKLFTFLAIASLLLAGTVMAHNPNGDREWMKGPPSVEEKLARISEALDLSDEQVVDLLIALQNQEQEADALREQVHEMIGPEICANRAATEDAIQAILTPEQAETWAQLREERQERREMREKRRKGRGELDCSQYEG